MGEDVAKAITVEDCTASIGYLALFGGQTPMWQWQGPKDGMAPVLSDTLRANPMLLTKLPWPVELVAETADAVIIRRTDVERAN